MHECQCTEHDCKVKVICGRDIRATTCNNKAPIPHLCGFCSRSVFVSPGNICKEGDK